MSPMIQPARARPEPVSAPVPRLIWRAAMRPKISASNDGITMKHSTSPMIPRIIDASASPDRRGVSASPAAHPGGAGGGGDPTGPGVAAGGGPGTGPGRWRRRRRWERRRGRGRRRYFHAATVVSSGRAAPGSHTRCRAPDGRDAVRCRSDRSRRTRRWRRRRGRRAPVQLTSRASSFDSIATHEPGPTTPSGGRSTSGPRSAAPTSTTAMPIAAIAPISFHGIRAGGPGAGRGPVAVGVDADRGRVAERRPTRTRAARRTRRDGYRHREPDTPR